MTFYAKQSSDEANQNPKNNAIRMKSRKIETEHFGFELFIRHAPNEDCSHPLLLTSPDFRTLSFRREKKGSRHSPQNADFKM